MKNRIVIFLVFLISNFGALGLGVFLMNNGSTSEWYYSLNKAPWTPQGWVFGAAWFGLMFCYTFYMTILVLKYRRPNSGLIALYVLQWILNVSWNYIFFNQHLTLFGLIVIISLWLLIGYFTFKFMRVIKKYTFLILPYLVWMIIATSLNVYIVIYN
jgi:tryptophan-rich sensory protein